MRMLTREMALTRKFKNCQSTKDQLMGEKSSILLGVKNVVSGLWEKDGLYDQVVRKKGSPPVLYVDCEETEAKDLFAS